MNPDLQIVIHLYERLMHFYPSNFRCEFEDEMRSVFTDLLTEASKRDRASVVGVCLRELRDWPRVLLVEYWLRMQKAIKKSNRSAFRLAPPSPNRFTYGRNHMNEIDNREHLRLKGKQHALLAGLPLLLFGLGIALNALIYQGPWYAVPSWRIVLSIVVGVIPMITIGIGAIVAIVRRLTDWGWTWLGASFMGIVLFVKTLVEEMAEEGRPLTSPAGEAVIGILILAVGAVLLGAAALQGWRRAGLLSLGFAGIMGLSICMAVTAAPFNRTDIALLAAPLGLLMAALVYAYAKGSDAVRIAGLLGVGIVNAGLILMADRVWTDWLTTRAQPSPIVPLLIFTTILLLAGPIASLFARPIQRKFRRT